MKNPGFDFTEATLDECVAAAKRYAAGGANWHNHMLKPGCLFNPRPGTYALLIENNSSGEMLACFCSAVPVEAAQHIVSLRHGADVTSAPEINDAQGSEPVILARMRELSRDGTDWHHHMMFPDCVLNPRKGEWLITLEAEGTEEILEYTAETEPFDVLRQVEALFFAQETKR